MEHFKSLSEDKSYQSKEIATSKDDWLNGQKLVSPY